MTILIIDDEPNLRRTVRKHLIRHAYEVVEANSAEEGLEMLKNNPITAAIVDMSMEGMGGLGFLKQYQAVSPLTRAIVLTGHPSIKAANQTMGGGANALAEYYLEKPVDFKELLKVITKITTTVIVGRLTLDLRRGEAYIDGELIPKLSEGQIGILKVLSRNPEKYFTFQDLAQEVRGESLTPDEAKNTLSSQFKRLRDRLDKAAGVTVIENAYGHGFRFSAEFLR